MALLAAQASLFPHDIHPEQARPVSVLVVLRPFRDSCYKIQDNAVDDDPIYTRYFATMTQAMRHGPSSPLVLLPPRAPEKRIVLVRQERSLEDRAGRGVVGRAAFRHRRLNGGREGGRETLL